MLKSYITRIKTHQKGITGIETAIIMIAFVVVASIFAYVVISAGMFSTQKSQEAVYKGLKEAENAIVIRGGVVAMAENTGENGYLSQMTFTLSNAMGGDPIDFTPPTANGANNGKAGANTANKVVISYIDPYQKIDDLYWTLTRLGGCDDDYLLDPGEQFQITIGNPVAGAAGGNLVDALAAHHLGTDTKFALQVTTPMGSTLNFERTTPGFIDSVMNLY